MARTSSMTLSAAMRATSETARRLGLFAWTRLSGVGFCSEGQVSRLEYKVERHPSGTADRLSPKFGINRCGSSFFPRSLDRQGAADDDSLVGEWRREVTLTLSSSGRYEIVSGIGDDRGEFEFTEGRIS